MNHATEASCEEKQLLLHASQQYESNSSEELPVTVDPSGYREPVSSTAIGKLIDSHQASHLSLVYLSRNLRTLVMCFFSSSSYHFNVNVHTYIYTTKTFFS